MYKILGTDGKEYGPVTVGSVAPSGSRRRVNAQTQYQAAGSTEWKPWRSYPELARAPAGCRPARGGHADAISSLPKSSRATIMWTSAK